MNKTSQPVVQNTLVQEPSTNRNSSSALTHKDSVSSTNSGQVSTTNAQTASSRLENPSSTNSSTTSSGSTATASTSARNTRESVPERVNRLTSYSQPTYVRAEKFAEGTIVELNTADTTILKKVPGIGSAFANRIVNYRTILRGYHSVTQLSEVYGIDEERYLALEHWFTADPSLINKIEINKIPQDSLLRHPYINYAQARVIAQLRRQKGKLTGWENLQLLNEFTDIDKIKLQPYLSFE